MEIAGIIALCILTAVVTLFLKQYKPEYSLVLSAAAGCVVTVMLIAYVSAIKGELSEVFSATGIDGEILVIVFKAMGICYIVSFASDLCKDFGQTSLASKVEMAGKISVVILNIPLIKLIVESALELIG